MQYYAHSVPDRGIDNWGPLGRQLHNVATRPGEFAAIFGARNWGKLLGWWNDLGTRLRRNLGFAITGGFHARARALAQAVRRR